MASTLSFYYTEKKIVIYSEKFSCALSQWKNMINCGKISIYIK